MTIVIVTSRHNTWHSSKEERFIEVCRSLSSYSAGCKADAMAEEAALERQEAESDRQALQTVPRLTFSLLGPSAGHPQVKGERFILAQSEEVSVHRWLVPRQGSMAEEEELGMMAGSREKSRDDRRRDIIPAMPIETHLLQTGFTLQHLSYKFIRESTHWWVSHSHDPLTPQNPTYECTRLGGHLNINHNRWVPVTLSEFEVRVKYVFAAVWDSKCQHLESYSSQNENILFIGIHSA